MKTIFVSRVAPLAAVLTAGAGASAVAQARDTVARGRLQSVVVRAPTVIAIGDTTRAARPFSSIRAAVDSLGFALQVFSGPVRQVIDEAHHAVYFMPRDLKMGYVIITPGRRPVTVSGLIGPDSLRVRVRTYLQLTHPLERDRS